MVLLHLFLVSSLALTLVLATEVDVDPNTKLLLIGFRHGNRNPCELFEDIEDEGEWAQEGLCQLTTIGKAQAYATGKSLRERYSESGILPENPMVDQVESISSSSDRSQMALQLVLAGAFPPAEGTFADWADKLDPSVYWQPVAYKIDNPIVKMSAVKNCPAQEDAYQPIKDGDLPFMQETFEENAELFSYIEEHTGWNLTGALLGDLGDIVFNMKLNNKPMPDWIENPTLEGWDGESLYEKLVGFQEFNQKACAKYPSCARMFSGYWLKDIIDRLNKKKEGESEDLKAVFYSSVCFIKPLLKSNLNTLSNSTRHVNGHSRYTLSAMRMMFMDYDALEVSGGFILEYRDQPEPAVRLLHHAPNEGDFASGRNLTIAKLMHQAKCREAADEDNGWCPLDTFISSIEKNSFDYLVECELAEIPKEKKEASILEADCNKTKDKMKNCPIWATKLPGYCNRDDAKFVFCRKTCLCGMLESGGVQKGA